MLHAAMTQTKLLLRGRGARGTFLILFALSLFQFFKNVLKYQGYDVIGMFHPMRLLSLSYDQTNADPTLFLVLIYWVPLLICLPAGLSLAADQSTGADTLLLSRLGPWRFLASRLLAVFFTTATVFAAPFLLEALLNSLAFPLGAEGTLTFYNRYDPKLIEEIRHYGFSALYRFSPYLYAVWKILLFGAFAGLLAAAAAALSAVLRVKFRVFLMLPVFVLLMLSNRFAGNDLRWYLYVFAFCGVPRSRSLPWLFASGALGFIGLCWWLGSRKDHLK